ncbi:hypothetical protein NQ117_17925 [Paenibacillus sp. SC116]|uniref:hypothetical protein n=1 Tax=Paenibacillus sp. SC116 TaxID=2968986 RepID=UPI00215B2ACC|nr:hypothetical protein [Paenibacillus sp. SC116]MCR8845564.1 hypothetical protein [Paenibacillus sp. SC116]
MAVLEFLLLIFEFLMLMLTWEFWVVIGILGLIVGSILFPPIGGIAILVVCLVIALIVYLLGEFLNEQIAKLEAKRRERRNQKRIAKQQTKERRANWRKELWIKIKDRIGL